MPAQPKTSDDEIIEATLVLLESKGPGGFSMSDVAREVGIRAPSLYGRFTSRAELLDRVELALWRKLTEALGTAAIASDAARGPVETLKAQAHAYRRFAKANPNGYTLMYGPRARHWEDGAAARAAALAPCIPAFAALVGEAGALAAARVLTPFLHGFVSMELSQAFRLGGELDEAFKRGVDTIIDGLVRW